jgi:hypothetical protein
MFRPKSLNPGKEICRDLKILAFLDSFSQSQSRSAWILAFSRRDFPTRQDFSSFSDLKGLDNLNASQQSQHHKVSTVEKILTL